MATNMIMLSYFRFPILLVLLLRTCRIASAAGDSVLEQSIRGATLRRSVLDVHSYDFFGDSKKSMKQKSKKGMKKKGKKNDSLKLGKGKKGGKGKGSSKKGSSKKGSSKKGSLIPTTAPPNGSSAPNSPTAPPNMLPTAPSTAPPTSSPTISEGLDFVTVALTPYNVSYLIDPITIPRTGEAVTVAAITASFLKTYFEEVYINNQDTTLQDFTTRRMVPDSAEFDGTYIIDYNSMAVFSIQSVIPTASELDTLLSQAFLNESGEILLGLIQSLPSENLFSTTSEITEAKVLPPPPGARPAGRSAIPIVAAVGASAFILAIFGVVVYKRGQTYDELGKLDDSEGHMTVAGGTYMGNSVAYSESDVLSDQQDESENRSVAWQSERAMSTKAISEEGSMSDSASVRSSLSDAPDEPPIDPLAQSESAIEDGNESEEEEGVPMRVVDLIKRYSTSYIPRSGSSVTSV